MTDLMKRYGFEYKDNSTELILKITGFLNNDIQLTRKELLEFMSAIWSEMISMATYIKTLKAQLTWRPVSEKPEKAGLYNIRFTRDGIIRVFTSVAVYDEVFEDEEQGFDGWYDIPQDVHVISWLPIPPAQEGE